MPFEEWLYGDPPDPVQFVRFNNNRVIRVEIAKVGEEPEIRTENEMGDYWNTQPAQNTRIVKLGDQAPAQSGSDTAPRKPPSLRNPGEKLPADTDASTPQTGPVQFPKDQDKTQAGSQGTSPPQGTSTPSGQQPQSGTAQPQSNPSQSGSGTPPPAPNPLVAAGGVPQ
jgi:hypothetical protein